MVASAHLRPDPPSCETLHNQDPARAFLAMKISQTQTMPAWELRFTKGWFTRGGATSICPTPGCDFFASIRSLSPWRPSSLILRSKQCVEQPALPCVNPPHHDFPEVQGVLPLASVLCCTVRRQDMSILDICSWA